MGIMVLLVAACSPKSENTAVTVVWQEQKAVAVVIPERLAAVGSDNWTNLAIQLASASEDVAILGTLSREEGGIVFTPVVPFSYGHRYRIVLKNKTIGEFEVSAPEGLLAPELISIYPTLDTVPENLLKVYLRFSTPMAEGRSLSLITVLRNDRDTMKGTFLDLQPELWNAEGTLLTLWLDPGRIKRDLIPNKELGNPLQKGEHYTIRIASDWRSKEGQPMTKAYARTFFVRERDERSPDVMKWKLDLPKAGSTDKLDVHFGEPLDYSLVTSAIALSGPEVEMEAITLAVNASERSVSFSPSRPWPAGEYRLTAESRLEDLAGNNLNRLFDRDLSAGQGSSNKAVYERVFIIQ